MDLEVCFNCDYPEFEKNKAKRIEKINDKEYIGYYIYYHCKTCDTNYAFNQDIDDALIEICEQYKIINNLPNLTLEEFIKILKD